MAGSHVVITALLTATYVAELTSRHHVARVCTRGQRGVHT
jgi:hypothetical protein